MNSTPNTGSIWWRRIAGSCALLLYAAVCSPFGLGLAMLVGSLDPNHQILSGTAEAGDRLVLHHTSHSTPHHHGFAARALTLFAQPQNGVNADHILQFSSADTLKSTSRTPAPPRESCAVLLVFQSGELLAHAQKDFASSLPLFLPDTDIARFCSRSTALLI